ncbi:hypothetical protein [Massilia timonae]|uniref:Putative lipoprotein n=1 Tax=Massilia timonae TaxID=47229 RepID=A0A1S2NG97_9BURK|nr:hypothetical protein [Massilia timonae]OIJ43800.1 putative lipoprotein [Massilia timonae]
MPTFYKLLLSTLVAAGALTMCMAKSELQLPAPIVMRAVSGVENVELRHIGFDQPGAGPFQPLFGLDDALWANYPSVLYLDKVYRRAGPGSFVVHPRGDVRARYVVEEHADRSEERLDRITSLSIHDRDSQELLGRKYLRARQIEAGRVPVGEEAMAFVRRVLGTAAPAGGRLDQPSYGAAPVTHTALRAGRIDPPIHGGDGCPPSYRIETAASPRQFDAGAWSFRPWSDVDSFACTGNFILVASGDGAHLLLDLLDPTGKHLFQTEVAMPLDARAEATLQRLRVNGERLQVDVHYRPGKLPDGKPRLRQRFRMVISMTPPEPGAPAAAVAVK